MKTQNLTENEIKVINGIKRLMECNVDATFEELREETYISIKRLRGIVSSLIQKHIVSVNENYINLI